VIGQGTRTLLITTNEPVKRLHPATRRPGPCLADIEFTALSVAEANAWLAAGAPTPAFGFARALTENGGRARA
jgi:hypothetical protein